MREIDRLHEQFIDAWLKKDAAFVDRMLAPEYVYVGPNGQVADRKAIMGVITSPAYNLKSAPREDVRIIELAPNVVALLHRSRAVGSYQGRAFKDNHRCVAIFLKRGRGWVIAYEQCSPITA